MCGYNWTHRDWGKISDPINVVFFDIPIDEITKFLLSEGWEIATDSFSSDQFIPSTYLDNLRPQDIQLIRPLSKWKLYKRYHIRMWNIDGHVIGGVHMDIIRGRGHVVPDFESVEKYFGDACKKNSTWTVLESNLDLDNRFAGYETPYNNGKATVIKRK